MDMKPPAGQPLSAPSRRLVFPTGESNIAGGRPAPQPNISPSSASNIKALRTQHCILVVDDDLVIRESVSLLLEDEGYRVDQAENGLEALAQIERRRPSVVLLDMRMPVMDGWEFAAELRRRGIDVPVVAMTATSDAHRWADEIGAVSYIGKPFDPDDLLALMDRICGMSGL
jgi:CheY-like chemotaxis protein